MEKVRQEARRLIWGLSQMTGSECCEQRRRQMKDEKRECVVETLLEGEGSENTETAVQKEGVVRGAKRREMGMKKKKKKRKKEKKPGGQNGVSSSPHEEWKL